MTWISENLIALIAMSISIAVFILTQRNISKQVRADALKQVRSEITLLNERLEAEIGKLQDGLDRCIKERVTFKGEIIGLKKALKVANIEVDELSVEIEGLKEDV